MRLKPILVSYFISIFYMHSFGQAIKNDFADLESAKTILVNKTYIFSSSTAGFGKKQEFPKNGKRQSTIFKEEKNSTWLLISMPYSGTFSFEISPKDPADDYDWMVYRYNKKLGSDIARNIALPLRSNISRNDHSVAGKTGLKDGFQNMFAVPGPGKSFSKTIEVNKGDTLALIIDNIYKTGSGFTFNSKLVLGFPLTAIIKGRIFSNVDKMPLPAQLICEDDSTGTLISQTTANATGAYTIKVPTGRSLNLTAKYKNFIFKSADVILNKAADSVNFYLEPVDDGKKLILFNIHFAPDKDIILFSAEPEITRLINFLKEYPDYDARIIGHTNNNPFADSRYLQRLSFNRAMAVKKKLLASGIIEDRISCMGMGGKAPIVTSKDPLEAMKNLRVEIELSLRTEEETVKKAGQ